MHNKPKQGKLRPDMIKHEKISALVISRRNTGDADRLVTFFTREHGLLRVMAKGVRVIPSRRGGHLEPFTRVAAIINVLAGRYYLGPVETTDYFSSLHNDHDALLRASLTARIVLGLFGEDMAQAEIFNLLLSGWRTMPDLAPVKRCLLEVSNSLQIIRLAGVLPDLSACQLCHQPLARGPVTLDAARGGWTCLSCRANISNSRCQITPRGITLFRYLIQHPEKALSISIDPYEVEQYLSSWRAYCDCLVAVAPTTVHPGRN